MKLTSDVVTELAALRSNIKAMQEEEKELTQNLKDQMSAEKIQEFAPKHSPYKLCLDETERTSVSWKDEWMKLAKDKFGKTWKKVMTKLQDDSKTEVVALRVEPNENYNAEVA